MRVNVRFDADYAEDYVRNIISGTLEQIPQLGELAYSGQRYLSVDLPYGMDYTGTITGTWRDLTEEERNAYQIQVYSVTDEVRLVDSISCPVGGFWQATADIGCKEIRLVDGDGGIVDYGYCYLTDYVVELYSVTDAEYLQDTCKVWCVGGTYRFYSSKARYGTKLAKVRRVSDGEIVGISGVEAQEKTSVWDYDVNLAAEDALAFLKRQMNGSRFTHALAFGQPYEDTYAEQPMWCQADGFAEGDALTQPDFIATQQFYPPEYTGSISGTWRWLDDPTQYAVDVYEITDQPYLVCSCALHADGTWRTEQLVKVTETYKAYQTTIDPDTGAVSTVYDENGEPVYDESTTTVSTYYYTEPVIVNENRNNGFKDIRLVQKDWAQIPIFEIPEPTIEGPGVGDLHFVSSHMEVMRPMEVDGEIIERPFAKYRDYRGLFYTYSDTEYLVNDGEVYSTATVQLPEVAVDELNVITADTELLYLDDNTDPYEGSILQAAVNVCGLSHDHYRTGWSYPHHFTNPAINAVAGKSIEVGFDDAHWKRVVGAVGYHANTADASWGNYTKIAGNIEGTAERVPTYFFRKNFSLNNPEAIKSVSFSLRYDDACIVYLNGVVIGAYNLPEGGYSQNLAYGCLTAVDAQPAQVSREVSIPEGLLTAGENTVAVEVHQQRSSSSDFFFEFTAFTLRRTKAAEDLNPEIVGASMQMGVDETSVNFVWLCNQDVDSCVVATASSGESVRVSAEGHPLSARAGYLTYKATVSGLRVGETYAFTLCTGEVTNTEFQYTVPEVSNGFSFVAAGDAQITNQTTEQNWANGLGRMKELFPDVRFVLHEGDQIDAIVDKAKQETQWEQFYAPQTLRSLPIATTVGNHDNSSNYRGHTNPPNVDDRFGATDAGGDYWFSYGKVLFINLNTNSLAIDQHQAFVTSAMQAYQNQYGEEPLWKIVVFHHSIFSVGYHALAENVLTLRAGLAPFFSEQGIDLCLMGHDHVYVRTYVMDGMEPLVAEYTGAYTKTNAREVMYYTLNSSSGSKFYDPLAEEFAYRDISIQERRPNLSHVQVTADAITITTYNTLNMSAVDSFTLHKSVAQTTATTWTRRRMMQVTEAVDIQPEAFLFSPTASVGRKIAKLARKNDNGYTIVGMTGASKIDAGRLPASYLIPADDPHYNRDGSNALNLYGYMLNSRCFIYDAGLSLIAFTLSGDVELCVEMLDRLRTEQNEDGSFNFSYDNYIGQLFEGYVRTGAIGWLVHGMCYYTLQTGDTSYLDIIRRAGDWLVSRQIADANDLRYGLLTGGYGSYNEDYTYIEQEIEWCSTEHNCSALQALTELALVLGDEKYKRAAALVKQALFTTLYDAENARFYQGVGMDGVDDAWAVDCCTWAGKTLLSILGVQYSREIADTVGTVYATQDKSIVVSQEEEHYNTRYSGATVDGVKPYAIGYTNPPDIVWSEGTLGYICLLRAIGVREKADYYLNEMLKLQYCQNSTGGILYVTETWANLPWEFHAWESLVSSAWLYILIKDPHALFPITARPLVPLVVSGPLGRRGYATIEPLR